MVWSTLLAEPISVLVTMGFWGKQHNALKVDFNFKPYDLGIQRV